MVAWFIVAIATLALFGYVAFTGVGLVNSQATSGATIEVVRRLNSASAALQKIAYDPTGSGTVMLPVGQAMPTGGGWTLPPAIQGLAATPMGGYVTYCPFGASDASATGSATIRSNDGSSYAVSTVASDTDVYVSQGRPAAFANIADTNMLGYLMASRVKGVVPSCDQVSYDSTSGLLSAPNAIVRAISRNRNVDQSRAAQARGVIWYVSPSVADGAGSGLNMSTPSSLNDALNYYRLNTPQAMRIKLANGSYTFTNGLLDQRVTGTVDHLRSALSIEALNPGNSPSTNPVTITQAGTGTNAIFTTGRVNFLGVNLTNVTPVIANLTHTIYVQNSRIGALTISAGAEAIFSGTSEILAPPSTGYSALITDSAHMSVTGTLTVDYTSQTNNAIGISNNSSFTMTAGTLNYSPTTGSDSGYGLNYVGSNSMFSLANVNVNILGKHSYGFILDGGRFLANVTNITTYAPDAALFATQNGAFWSVNYSTITGSSAANLPGVVIDEQSGGYATATGTALHGASWCWRPNPDPSVHNNLYSQSAPGNVSTTGSTTSAVTADEAPPAMSATPSASEIQLYQAAQQRNAQRAQLRVRNTTTMTCTIGS